MEILIHPDYWNDRNARTIRIPLPGDAGRPGEVERGLQVMRAIAALLIQPDDIVSVPRDPSMDDDIYIHRNVGRWECISVEFRE